MIAHRQKSRERRTEILQRLSGLTGQAGRFRASRRGRDLGDGESPTIEPLCRVLADLGPVFAAYGVYLSTRGDLLAPADRRLLAAIGHKVSPLPPEAVRAIVRVEASRTRLGTGAAAVSSSAVVSVEDEPFDTRLLIQRHHSRLPDGRDVVVRVVRCERSVESDLDLLPLLRQAVGPLLSDSRLLVQSIEDFRGGFAAATNGLALADALDSLRHDARELEALKIPKIDRALSTPRVLVLERLPGRRLPGDTGPGLARLLCELWLRQAFDGGLVAADPRPGDVIVLGRSQVGIDEGTFAVLPSETRKNLLKYLVAVAIDEPGKALDCLLREFEATRQRTPFEQLDRLFRQMVPDMTRDEPSDGPGAAGRLAETVLAQWRLAIEHGYRPLRHGLPVLRGLVQLSATIGELAPGRDALLEGLKDYRVTRLLNDIHAMLEPMYWLGRVDKITTVMLSAPRILDEALAAATPDRTADERKTSDIRSRSTRAGAWVIPAIAALAVVGLAYGRAPPASGPWTEELAALLFLLLGGWMLRSAIDPER
jgi:predicted unusual protein kinase regulating ubiquinone biosynthesis (AarF/ABC1/UbiB family)